MYWPRLFATIIFCLWNLLALAQTKNPIKISVSKNEDAIGYDELLDLTLKITNRSTEVLDGLLYINLPNTMELASAYQIVVLCKPGEDLFIPVKIFITAKAEAGKTHLVKFLLSDRNNVSIANLDYGIDVVLKRSINLLPLISNLLLEDGVGSIGIPIQLSNIGNTTQDVKILLQFPSLFINENSPASIQVSLKASSDTVLYFNKKVTGAMLSSDGFDVTITGLYADNDIFGMGYVRVQSARSTRRFALPTLNERFGENYIRISSQNMFSANQSYLFNGNGNIGLNKGALNYNYDISTWKSKYIPTSIRNTYASYEGTRFGFTAGNINRNFELFLSGRGLAAHLTDTASHTRYEIGYMNENADLLNNSYFNPVSGQAAWLTIKRTEKKWKLNGIALYEDNPITNSKNIIIGNILNLSGKHLQFNGSLSGGFTSEFSDINSNRLGISGGVEVLGMFRQFSFSSNNFYSSGYYPGTRRGALSFLHRINWTKENTSIWTNMDYYRYHPKTLGEVLFEMPLFSNFHTEGGISRRISDRLQLSAASGFSIEKNDAYQFIGEERKVQAMHAATATFTLNFAIRPGHYLSAISENDVYTTSFDPVKRFRHRSIVSYSYAFFNINTVYQRGFFFLGEAANRFREDAGLFRSANVTASVHKDYFDHRLKMEAGLAFQYNTYSGRNWYINGRMEYNFWQTSSFYAGINHNRFGDYRLNIFEMGLIHKLKLLPRIGAKINSMDVFVYKDLNQNDRYDKTDSVAEGHHLLINNIIFITSQAGTIHYKNLPPGEYHIAMINTNGWYAPEQNFILEKKNHIEISLKRTGTLRGSINFKSSPYSYEVGRSLAGILVSATDQFGKIYSIRTNSNGVYAMYIPVGKYSVTLTKGDFTVEIEVTGVSRALNIEPGKITINNYELNVKEKKVESKKFVSPNKVPDP